MRVFFQLYHQGVYDKIFKQYQTYTMAVIQPKKHNCNTDFMQLFNKQINKKSFRWKWQVSYFLANEFNSK